MEGGREGGREGGKISDVISGWSYAAAGHLS